MKWDGCSYPKFSNKDQPAPRPMFAEASPYGTAWSAKVTIDGTIQSQEASGDTPQEALEAALANIQKRIADVLKPGPKPVETSPS